MFYQLQEQICEKRKIFLLKFHRFWVFFRIILIFRALGLILMK